MPLKEFPAGDIIISFRGTDDRKREIERQRKREGGNDAFWSDRPGLMLLMMFMSLLFDLLLFGSALLTRIDLPRVS